MQDVGMNPVWNTTIEIPLCRLGDDLEFVCYDEDLIMDSWVGNKIYKVRDLVVNEKKWFQLDYKGTHAADILMEGKFTRFEVMNQRTMTNQAKNKGKD